MRTPKSALGLVTFLVFGLSAVAQNPPPVGEPLLPAPAPWQTAPPPAGFEVDPDSPAAMALSPRCEERFNFQLGADLFVPQIHQKLQAPVNVGNLYTATVSLPTAEQDLGGGLLVGLSVGIGPGEFSAAYRFLASDGNSHWAGFDPTGPTDLFTRLDIQMLDLDYSMHKQLGTQWDVRLNVGAKLGSVFFDTFGDSPMFSDHVSNFFFGAGPHAALALTRRLGNTGLALFGRADFGTLVGQVRQHYSEAVFDANGNALGFGETTQSLTRAVPVLSVQLGFSALPFAGRWGTWQAGYQFEQWWTVGQVGSSTGNLILHGFFARYEYRY